jgi:UDP-2,4-diacetamido-2,4,6-trideoxy-beta-L-altropyranose hydrolase
MTLIVIRADASFSIGSGHIMRCRTLARALHRRGATIIFISRLQPGDLIEMLEQEFRVLKLPELSRDNLLRDFDGHPLTGRTLYSDWLGCTEEQDAIDCLAALAEIRCDEPAWLVVDHYGLGSSWQRRMQNSLRHTVGTMPRILVLDDIADRSHHSSLLVDANRLELLARDPYHDLVPDSCTTLLGPGYALLDPVYAHLQPLLPVRSHLTRVLIFFGGMDASNYAALALDAMCHPELLHLSVDVVVGAAAPHRVDLATRVMQRPGTRLHVALPSLAGLMARADLAIGAAGTASWERACLGLPTLVVSVAENQLNGARALEAAGVARHLNLHEVLDPAATLQTAILDLQASPDSLQAMSKSCLHLGDGRGLARVVAAMLKPAPGLRLRPAQVADLWIYHWWANDPEVRRQSFNCQYISLQEHMRWYNRQIASPLTLLRILEDGDGLPLGQIRFERAAQCDRRALIGFSLDRLARGLGLAPVLLELGCAELASCWGGSVEAYGEVLAGNPSSCRAFLRAGFQEVSPPRTGVRCFARTASSSL